MATHPALQPGSLAVVTGGASGIGLAAAKQFAALGLKVCIADLPSPQLEAATAALTAAGVKDAFAASIDVSKPEQLQTLAQRLNASHGGVAVLMNNAGIQPGSSLFGPDADWERVLAVNLWGVLHGTRAFVPAMIASGKPGVVINTGSKQGITTPPGDPAYNLSKAGVKVFTEALQHELRNTPGCAVTAHLLIPGYVHTGLTARGRTEKPAAAWTPEQTAQFMMASLDYGDFYILCPDNDVPRALDEKRIAWAAGDIIHNRPPLSRWHPDFAAKFAGYLKT